MIVDDEQANNNVLKGLLNFHEYMNVKTITDPRQVYETFIGFNPDLIMLDLSMPYLNGFQIMKQLKSLIPEDTFLPILVLTADVTTEAKRKALKDGAKDFLTKPLDLIEVELRIRNLLQTRFLYQELEKMNRKLVQTNEDLEAFSYSVSHDLRTPLRHISSYLSLMKDEFSDQLRGESIRYMDVISGAAVKMGILIEKLLNFSRIGKTEISKKMLQPATLVQSILEDYKNEIARYNCIVTVEPLPKVCADGAMLIQVFENLISNAIKYSSKSEHPVIRIWSEEEEGSTRFFINDNGAGFDMKFINRLFGVFQRLHAESQYEGIGIGLANVKRIIEKHDGKVSAIGEVGQGATFSFSLPAFAEERVPVA
jgi:light-regulated signal transduction histidine kinase (bacteriophytochrome)